MTLPSDRAGVDTARELATATAARDSAIVAIGLGWAAAFVIVGVTWELQLYGDGSIFSYAVAVEASWTFHWHNIAARLFVHVFSHLPAEFYVAATGDARGGVAVYGASFFAAPLIGLIATSMSDRSPGRRLFVWACGSTALLCPLVFGCPTEMWFAHAVFWPTLALCHYAPADRSGTVLVMIAFAVLVLTHEGAVIFGATIVATAALPGLRSRVFFRACVAFAVAMAIWIAIKIACPPDDYIAPVMARASHAVIDPGNFSRRICVLIVTALGLYVAVHMGMRRLSPTHAPLFAGLVVVAALAAYWIGVDDSVHAEDRYVVRTVLLVATPVMGMLAAFVALMADDRLRGRAFLGTIAQRISAVPAHSVVAALSVVTLIHIVETAKFVTAWTHYRSAVQALATGAASDPVLGDARFVSSERIPRHLDRLGWNSTTPYLSVMVAPRLSPSRLVVDPGANYFWLPCAAAMENEAASRAVPATSRELVRLHACLHPRVWTLPAS